MEVVAKSLIAVQEFVNVKTTGPETGLPLPPVCVWMCAESGEVDIPEKARSKVT